MKNSLFGALILILLLAAPCEARQITLSTGEDQTNARSAYLNALLAECFSRMDVDLTIEIMPHKRSLEAAQQEVVDGTFIRTELIAKNYPELVMVPVPLIESRVTAYATDPAILESITCWESMTPYRVAYIDGWQWVEHHLPGCTNLCRIKKKMSLLLFLSRGRADIAIYEETLGAEEIRKMDIKNIHVLDNPLSVTNMYLYMHRRHLGMVPEIADTLSAMIDDGTFQALRIRHLGE